LTAPFTLRRGATVLPDGGVRFELWAPRARSVAVQLTTGTRALEYPLDAQGGGVFAAVIADAGAGARYSYRLDGGPNRPDPVSRLQPAGVHGPSEVVDPSAYAWTETDWKGPAMADLAIYELHVGTFTEAGTFAGVVDRLPYLRDLGITALELMPVAEFPGARNWGYDGVHPYAPHHAYGGPAGLRALVDAAHQQGLAVILDVVYNHLGPEGNYLADFGPYFTDCYRTPWGPALNFDGPDSDEVRRYVVDNACYWISEYHVDGLRLDAVHAIFDFGARHILEELASAARAAGAAQQRRVIVIAESALNDPRVVRAPARGGWGMDGQWNDDFHHAVHVALTGERDGYYADYDGAAAVAKALQDRFVLDGSYSPFRRRHHGAPAGDVPEDRFVVAVQTHDQVGNRARGERLSALVSFPALKLAAAAMLVSPYVPLLFMGEEYGETRPFLYFVSHGDPQLVEAVREGRRREFADFDWQGALPEPDSPETFAASRLSWALDGSSARAVSALYRDLLALRRSEPALRPGAATVRVGGDAGSGLVTLALMPPGGAELFAALNLTAAAADAVPPAAGWTIRLSTEDPRYGGSGVPRPDPSGALPLAPWSAVVLQAGTA